MKNIVLIGMPGSGKSTVGVVLAKLIGFDFADTDIIISRKMKKPLPMLAQEYGFEDFIALEGAIGSDIRCESTVIATGGSMALSERAMEHFAQNGVIVWLDVPLEELKKRLPENLSERGVSAPKGYTLEDICISRKPFYEKHADIRIDCENGADGTAAQIVTRLTRSGLL